MAGDPSRVSDAELLRLGDEDGEPFGLLYDRYLESIFAWFQARLGEAAADMTAEVFARAWLNLARRLRPRARLRAAFDYLDVRLDSGAAAVIGWHS